MEALWVLLGLLFLLVILILPICTFVAVAGLRGRLEALERAVRDASRQMARASRAAEADAPFVARVAQPAPSATDCVRAAAASAAARVVAGPAAPPARPQGVPVQRPLEPVATPPPVPRMPPPQQAACAVAQPPETPLAPVLSAVPAPVPGPDEAAGRLLRRMWSWLIVGEEFRRPGVATEFAVATTWLVRLGVLSLVLMMGFVLQLSIARGLLGPAGRVALTVLGGTVLVGLGLRCMRRRYQALGQGFIGGGLALFYFACFAASMLFGLIPVFWAFVCMAGVTAAAVILALRLEALSIAVLGVLGGYATPLMLRDPQPNHPALYAYLALLALGIVGVAVRRQWPILTWLSLSLNSMLFLLAVGDRYGWRAAQGDWVELFALGAYFAIYSAAIVAYAVRNRTSATSLEVVALFANALAALAEGALLIGCGADQQSRLACLALALAAFHAVLASVFLTRERVDRVLVSGYLALAVVFLGLALPLLFTGHVLSALFALLAAALLWLSGRLASRLLRAAAFACYALVLARLAVGLVSRAPFVAATAADYWAGLTDRLVSLALPIASLFAGWRLLHAPPAPARHAVGDATPRAAGEEVGLAFFVVVFYVGLVTYATRELAVCASAFLPVAESAGITVLWSLFMGHLLAARARLSAPTFRRLVIGAAFLLGGQWLLCSWLGVTWPVASELRHAAAFSWGTALPRLTATAALGVALLAARSSLSDAADGSCARARAALLSAALAAGFLYVTFEVATCCTAFVPGFRGWAVSVVWGVYGLSLLLGGLRFARRALRLAGLALFCVTIGKIFLVDLADSAVLYRLIAFGALGGVLLLAAYAYLRNQEAFKGAGPAGDGAA